MGNAKNVRKRITGKLFVKAQNGCEMLCALFLNYKIRTEVIKQLYYITAWVCGFGLMPHHNPPFKLIIIAAFTTMFFTAGIVALYVPKKSLTGEKTMISPNINWVVISPLTKILHIR
jgi:hypothetical protein